MDERGRARKRGADLFERFVHDVRNPLGIIMNFAEGLGDASHADRDELGARIRVNAEVLLHVVEEFSLLYLLRRGRVRPVAESWNVAEVAAGIAAELEAMERRQGAIKMQVDVGLLAVGGGHLQSVLRWLLREALRGTARDAELVLIARAEGSDVVFEIAAPRPVAPPSGVVPVPPWSGVAVELAERAADLYGGTLRVEQEPRAWKLRLAVRAGASGRKAPDGSPHPVGSPG